MAAQPHTSKPYHFSSNDNDGDTIYQLLLSSDDNVFSEKQEQKSGSVRSKTDKTLQETLRTSPHEEMLINLKVTQQSFISVYQNSNMIAPTV